MVRKLTTYDPAEDLTSDQAIAIFMAAAFQTNDAGYVAHAMGVVARAKGMARIAAQTYLQAAMRFPCSSARRAQFAFITSTDITSTRERSINKVSPRCKQSLPRVRLSCARWRVASR